MNRLNMNFDHDSDYEKWRDKKLAASSHHAENLIVEIKQPQALSPAEIQRLLTVIDSNNMAIFKLSQPEQLSISILKQLGAQLGLHTLDTNLYADENDISELRVIDGQRRGEFIPYTNRPLGWHTDGYYNSFERSIRGFSLYCQQDAAEGGDNQLLDPELAYIHLRETSPEYITALSRTDCFTIPATIENDVEVRPQQSAPVFAIDTQSKRLNMRYTRRKTYIQWRDDDLTQAALSRLGDLLDSDSAPILHVHLNPGEGLLCNNVLHSRSGFRDDPEKPRVLFRARYYERITTPE